MGDIRRDYRSYLLRLYRVRKGRESYWRASLQSPQGGEPLHFASLRELISFLEQDDDLREDGEQGGTVEVLTW